MCVCLMYVYHRFATFVVSPVTVSSEASIGQSNETIEVASRYPRSAEGDRTGAFMRQLIQLANRRRRGRETGKHFAARTHTHTLQRKIFHSGGREDKKDRERDALPLMVVGSEGKKEEKKVIAVIHTFSLMVVVTFSLACRCAQRRERESRKWREKNTFAQ